MMLFINIDVSYTGIDFSFSPNNSFTFDPTGKYTARGNNPYIPNCDSSKALKEIQHKRTAEVINMTGMDITYLPVKYNTKKAVPGYGEDAISGFHHGRKMKASINLASYTVFMTPFGNMSDSDIVIYIAIKEFEKVWGPASSGIYPLAGDLFYINDSACDRPLQQSPMVYEISEKDDKANPVDFLFGHYVYKLDAKRFAYSYQPNSPEERFSDDNPSDTKQYGRLPDGDNPPDLSNTDYDVDVEVSKEFVQKKSITYGGY